jgi:hypothetical protein
MSEFEWCTVAILSNWDIGKDFKVFNKISIYGIQSGQHRKHTPTGRCLWGILHRALRAVLGLGQRVNCGKDSWFSILFHSCVDGCEKGNFKVRRSSVILRVISWYWHFRTTYHSHLRGPVGCPEIVSNQIRTYVEERPRRTKTTNTSRWKPEISQLPSYLECNRTCWTWVFHTLHHALYQRL